MIAPGIVHAVDLADAEAVDQAVVDHRLAARPALLRRLEDHRRRAVEVARLGEIFGGAEQHRRVPVVAAGVHFPRHLGLVRQAGLFLERQRVHIGAHPDDHVGDTIDDRHSNSPSVAAHPAIVVNLAKAAQKCARGW
jgi:hypothetical protein